MLRRTQGPCQTGVFLWVARMIETSSLPLTDAANLPAGARAVLAYWLGNVPPSNEGALEKRALWFTKSDAVDREIAHQFGDHVEEAKAGELDHWAQTAEGTLALLIVLDQFTRNIWRGKPESFSGDEKALALAKLALSEGRDAQVASVARMFFYLPLEHAEDMACQNASVAAFAQLAARSDAASHAFFNDTLDYARRHREVVAQFGRFPHRNPMLGRSSTPEELHYLAQPGAGF